MGTRSSHPSKPRKHQRLKNPISIAKTPSNKPSANNGYSHPVKTSDHGKIDKMTDNDNAEDKSGKNSQTHSGTPILEVTKLEDHTHPHNRAIRQSAH